MAEATLREASPIQVSVRAPARSVRVSARESASVVKGKRSVTVSQSSREFSGSGGQAKFISVRSSLPEIQIRVNTGVRGLQGDQGLPPEEQRIVAAVPIGGRRAITYYGRYCDPEDLASLQLYAGVSTHAAEAGFRVLARQQGALEDSALFLIPGEPVFVGAEGRLTQVAPERALCVGFALTESILGLGPRDIIVGG